MPPRKSNVSTTSAADDGQATSSTPAKERDGINIEDLSLPRTMVSRIAKGVLPANILLSKDVVLALQKSATVFINYLAAQANTTTMSNNRRTVPPQAIFEALRDLEYEAFIPRVSAEVDKFIEIQSSKRNDYRKKLKESKDGKEEEGGDNAGAEGGGDEDEDEETASKIMTDRELEGEERGSKRVRVSEGGDSVRAGPGDASPSDQLKQQLMDIARRHLGASSDEEDEGGEEEDGEGQDGKGEEEEEEEEDDEDEYPDEGHREESLEMEDADADAGYGRRSSAYGPGGEGGGGDSSGSEDEEMDD